MQYTPALQHGMLLRRYKRFLADVQLSDGSQLTIHCPNTGSMKNCLFVGETIWFSTSDNPKRKYPHTWELSYTPAGELIGINSSKANTLAVEAIQSGLISELSHYSTLKTEVKYGDENSRIDILLSSPEQPDCYIEVKSCTLLEQNCGYFPDAVTTRGQKHLRELIKMVQLGHKAVLLFVVQHTGIEQVAPAEHIDPTYSALFKQAIAAGVEVLAYTTSLSSSRAEISHSLPVRMY